MNTSIYLQNSLQAQPKTGQNLPQFINVWTTFAKLLLAAQGQPTLEGAAEVPGEELLEVHGAALVLVEVYHGGVEEAGLGLVAFQHLATR